MDDKELFAKRLRELAMRAHYTGIPSYSRFLETPAELLARSCAKEADVCVRLFGGYDGSERKIACFSVGDTEDADYPITVIDISWNPKYATVGHRDLLGALMGLGIEREVLGDIVFSREDGKAYVFVCEDIADYLCASLEEAGRTKVKTCIHQGPLMIRESEGVSLRVTVAAERMDAVIAAVLKLSRGEAQKLIVAGLVSRNHIPEIRSDVFLSNGDLLSVRGYGRMRVVTIDETLTKKGRRAVHVFRYT